MRRTLIAAIALALLLGGASQARGGAEAEPLRVLFVGNSLTTTNDLPELVDALATAGGKELEVGRVTFDGYSLEDHWDHGAARNALASGSWDVVVMQQGPSALPESQVDLRKWAGVFGEEARAAGTRLGLLTVWPESYRQYALADVIVSYRAAAQAAGGELYPAGEAWFAAWQCNSRLGLYGRDGFHPSRLGTYTAALVVYGRLFRAPLVSPALRIAGVQPRTARLVQSAAATALGRKLAPARRCG
jgi:hypothetical protein